MRRKTLFYRAHLDNIMKTFAHRKLDPVDPLLLNFPALHQIMKSPLFLHHYFNQSPRPSCYSADAVLSAAGKGIGSGCHVRRLPDPPGHRGISEPGSKEEEKRLLAILSPQTLTAHPPSQHPHHLAGCRQSLHWAPLWLFSPLPQEREPAHLRGDVIGGQIAVLGSKGV